MNWLETRIDEYRKNSEARRVISAAADQMYEALEKDMMAVLEQAAKSGILTVRNGMPRHRIIKTDGNRILRLDLDEDGQGITAISTDGPAVKCPFKVDANDTVYLSHDGQKVRYSEASKLILDPFLFGGRSPYAIASSD